jgi:hypothetical protein
VSAERLGRSVARCANPERLRREAEVFHCNVVVGSYGFDPIVGRSPRVHLMTSSRPSILVRPHQRQRETLRRGVASYCARHQCRFALSMVEAAGTAPASDHGPSRTSEPSLAGQPHAAHPLARPKPCPLCEHRENTRFVRDMSRRLGNRINPNDRLCRNPELTFCMARVCSPASHSQKRSETQAGHSGSRAQSTRLQATTG